MSSTEVSKNFKRTNPGPLDALYGPYDNLVAACAAVPNTQKLVDGVMVNFRQAQIVGIRTVDGLVDYAWRNGFTDADLKIENSDIRSLLSRVDQNTFFNGNNIDSYLLDFVTDINLYGITLAPSDVLHIDNIRRGKIYTSPSNYVRHLVRIGINGISVATWFEDTHVEPVADGKGNKIETLNLKSESSADIVGQITVNWAMVGSDTEHIYVNAVDRLKSRLNSLVTKKKIWATKFDISAFPGKTQNLNSAGEMPADKVKIGSSDVYSSIVRLDKSAMFQGSEIHPEVFNFLLDIKFTGLTTTTLESVHLYNIWRSVNNAGTPRSVIDIAINGVRFCQFLADNYVEPAADAKGNRFDTLNFVSFNGSGITGTARVNWSALTSGSIKQFASPADWPKALLSPKKYNTALPVSVVASAVPRGSSNVDDELLRLDTSTTLKGSEIDSKLVKFLLELKINGLAVNDSDIVHVFWAWRQTANPTLLANSFSIGLNGTRVASWTVNGYIEPAADAKGNIITQIELTAIGGSGVSASALVNWAALTTGSQNYYRDDLNAWNKGLLRRRTYTPAITVAGGSVDASTVIKGSTNVGAFLDGMEQNDLFASDTIPAYLRKFIVDIKFKNNNLSVPNAALVYVGNIRRKKQYTSPSVFVRSLVRMGVSSGGTGINILTWFRDAYVEPTVDASGNIYDTIELLPEQTTGVYAGIGATIKVNWAYVPDNFEYNYEANDTTRKQGLLSPNIYNKTLAGAASAIVKADISTATAPHRLYTVLNDVDPRNIVTGAAPLRQDLVRPFGLNIYVDRFLPADFPINTDVRFDVSGTDKYRLVSPRKMDLDANVSGVPIDHPTPSQIIPKSVVINGGTNYNNKTVNFNHISTRESTGADSFVAFAAIGDSTVVGLNTEIGAIDGYGKMFWGVIYEQFVKCRIDYLLSKSYSIADIQSFLNTGTSGVISAADQKKFRYYNIGTGANVPEQIDAGTITYRGLTKDFNLRAEGIGGTGYFMYINKPFNLGRSQGVWDVLGLGNGTGTDFTFTATQVKTLDRTAWNPTALVDTPAMRTWASSIGGFTGTDRASYVTWAQSKETNPTNRFYDKDSARTVTDTNGDVWQIKFSYAKYLSRWRTMTDATLTDAPARLSNSDPAKGTNVANTTDYDVFRPTHIVLQSCQNDTNTPHYGLMAFALAQAIKAEYVANSWGAVNIGLSVIDGAGTFFPKLYPEVHDFCRMNTGQRAVHNDNLARLLSAVTDEDTNRIWSICNTHVTPTARAIVYRNANTPEYEITKDPRDQFFLASRTSLGIHGHPNSLGHRVWAFLLYAWIKYTLGL